METQEDASALAFVTVSRGQQLVDATAIVEFADSRQAMAYTFLLRTRAMKTGLKRSLIAGLKGCPWLTNAEVGFSIRAEGADWAVRVAGGRVSQFLALFELKDDAEALVDLLQTARAFRLWTAVGGHANS